MAFNNLSYLRKLFHSSVRYILNVCLPTSKLPHGEILEKEEACLIHAYIHSNYNCADME